MKLNDINNYWLSRFDNLEEDYPTCFVCGKDKHLERCHLIPKALGGSYDVDNLVLLCNEHHKQAPNLALDKEVMLKWIEEESKTYDCFFHMKHDDLKEYHNSIINIGLRIASTIGEDYDPQDLSEFLLKKYRENTLIVSSHQQANTRTRLLFFKHMSEYKNLEVDYLKYLLNKSKAV